MLISCENEVFTAIATAIRAEYPSAFVSGEYVSQPPKFPAVSVIEIANETYERTQDSGSLENHARITFQIDVYSNLNKGKKDQCKTIIGKIDAILSDLGFTRIFLNPVQNMNDPTIYRMTGRYRGVVSKDYIVYGR